MGYTTEFKGFLTITPTMKPEHVAYINQFSETRRMRRNEFLTAERPDPIREAVELPVGEDGCYFVGEEGFAGQDHGKDVVEYNNPPRSQPGLWCKWVITEGGTKLEWSGMEKFYNYIEWLEYLIDNFMNLWGYKLNGKMTWVGEDRNDRGKIIVSDNEIKTKYGHVVYR